MKPGYLFWGTEDGFNSNLLANRTESSIDLKAMDDKIRPVKARNGIPLTEVYYLLFESGSYLFASAVDPTYKDNTGREGFLVCSVYFDKKLSLKGGVAEVLNFLIKAYKEKKASNQILTHAECDSKLNYLSCEPIGANPSTAIGGTLISRCTSNSELNLALSNKLLGFSSSLAFLFLSDVEGIGTLPADCKMLSWDEISTRSKQLSSAVNAEASRQKAELDAAHGHFKQILLTGESGNTEQAGTILLKMVGSHPIYKELLQHPEYAKLNSWYNAALAKDQSLNQEREAAFIDDVYNRTNRKLKHGDIEGAKQIFSELSRATVQRTPQLQALQSEISKMEEGQKRKKQVTYVTAIVLLLCFLGGGVYYIVRQPSNETTEVIKTNGDTTTISKKSPIDELKDEWPRQNNADIQLVLKVAEIQGYDSLKGKLTYSSGAKCYLLTDTGNMPPRHIPFELVDKLKNSSKSKEITDVTGQPFQDVKYYSDIAKSIVFIGKNNKYSIRASSQTKVLEFAVVSDEYIPKTDFRQLSASSNGDLFNSVDIKYLYRVLGYPRDAPAPKPKEQNPIMQPKPKDKNSNK
jgi:hypothetical protein